jgi:DNA-binding transcriptional regulator YiaG
MKDDFKEVEIIQYIRKLLNYRSKRAKLEKSAKELTKFEDQKNNSAKALGLKIAFLRKSVGLKQKEVAEALKINPSLIS